MDDLYPLSKLFGWISPKRSTWPYPNDLRRVQQSHLRQERPDAQRSDNGVSMSQERGHTNVSAKKQEVYKSTTLGEIPLSFTGRRLMQNLREEIQDLLRGAPSVTNDEWKPLSRARGKLALYISELEQVKPDITQIPDNILVEEVARRFYKARGGDL